MNRPTLLRISGTAAACGTMLALLTARAAAMVRITEFMADNRSTLADGDGNYSDWIEIHNDGSAAVNLAGWHLTDDAAALTKWTFPAAPLTNLAAGQRLVVFASGDHFTAGNVPVVPYFDAAGKLHVDFRLNADGGYLALVQPDGVTVASEFGAGGTDYPPQQTDVSYGYGAVQQRMLTAAAPLSAYVPADEALGLTWTAAGFTPAGWAAGIGAAGFDTAGDYTPLIGTNLEAAMRNANASVYLRLPFSLTDPEALQTLTLRMRYDDGFIAYLNGTEVAARNRPVISGTTVSLPLLQVANGISWSPGYSVPAQEGGKIEFGAIDNGGTLLRERTLLRFDASGLTGALPPVESVRLELTVQAQYGGAGSGTGQVDLHRVDPAQTAWTNFATAAEMHGNGAPPAGDAGSVPWTGGVNIFSTHTGPPLAAATVNRLAAPGTFYQWTITGGAAQQLLDDWRAGANAGLALLDTGAIGGRDYRSNAWGANGTAAQRPRLTVTFASAPPSWNAAASADRPDASAVVPEVIDLTASRALLQPGSNVLAIHGLNSAAGDSDFLIAPELEGFTGASDTSSAGYLANPTPGADARATVLSDFVRDTRFTSTDPAFRGRGCYDAPFPLTISSSTPGALIYYTTDGSAPHAGLDGTPVNGTLYTAPINVATTTTLRAAAFKANLLPTNVDTQTYVFVNDVVSQPAIPQGLPSVWGPVSADYAMDQRIVTDPLYAAAIRNDLKALPVVSLVLNQSDMFGPNGIYSNSEAAGDEWERPVSVEYFDPRQPDREFQIDAGVQILGSSQRYPQIRKHGFRVSFKSKYGAAKLDYPLYPGTTVNEFDNLSLFPGGHDGCAFNTDIPQNQPWPYGQATFARARWLFQSQLDAGNPGVHGDFVHLYINGLYWGLYRMNERPDAAYAAEYFGGSKDDYDAIKHLSAVGSVGQPNQYEVIDGDNVAWLAMYNLALAGLGTEAQYQAIRQYLNVESFCDYLIVNMVCGNRDWPDKNWYATRRRAPGAGFKFYCWDGEITLGLEDPHADRTGVSGANTPGYIYSRLRANAEFRRLFGDRVQKHLYNGGAMTVTNMQARFQTIAGSIESAIVPESARWGDASIFHPPPNTRLYARETHWRPEVTRVLTQIIPNRWPLTIQQFRSAALFPALDAPQFSQFGGHVPAGFALTITNPNAGGGSIHFTTYGSDPRVYGTGAVAPGLTPYSAPVSINSPTRVRARVLQGTTWSAEVDATFYPPQNHTRLVISELMYHPADERPGTEFIEFTNTGTAPLDLTGVRFTAGLNFAFAPGTVIAPGARMLVVENRALFEAAYGAGLPVAGEYQPSNLSNGGETLTWTDGVGNVIESFAYDDAHPWPEGADGAGYSLVRIAPAARLNPALPSTWRASVAAHGNPAASDAVPFAGGAEQLLAYALRGAAPALVSSGGEIHYRFQRNRAADDAILTVQVSSDLTAWHEAPPHLEWLSTVHHPDGTDTLTFRPAPGSIRQFLQVQVTARP